MIPFCMSAVNMPYWRQWARDNDRVIPQRPKEFVGSLKLLTPYVGKQQAAALIQLGFVFNEPYEIPGVGLVLLDQASPKNALYLGQASVLHWISLNDERINNKLRSLGILSWWTS